MKYLLSAIALFFILTIVSGLFIQIPYYVVAEVNVPQKNFKLVKLIIIEGEIRTVSAYSEFDSCHYENCIMASGKRAYIGAVACPREINLGTKVEINKTIYICEDRTALKFNGRFDIFMGYNQEAYDKAIQFGLQRLNVIIK